MKEWMERCSRVNMLFLHGNRLARKTVLIVLRCMMDRWKIIKQERLKLHRLSSISFIEKQRQHRDIRKSCFGEWFAVSNRAGWKRIQIGRQKMRLERLKDRIRHIVIRKTLAQWKPAYLIQCHKAYSKQILTRWMTRGYDSRVIKKYLLRWFDIVIQDMPEDENDLRQRVER